MTFKTIITAGCASAIALSGATAAFAQAPVAPRPVASAPNPTPPPPPNVTHGAPIAGVCIFSGDTAIATSNVGKFVFTRLQQLGNQAQAEISGEDNAINTDAKALDGQRASLDQNSFEQRAAAIQVRANALQRKAQQRQAEMDRTRQKAFGRLSQEIAPLISQAYQAKGCSLLISREALTLELGNPAMDITPQVVTALNGKIQQFAFERERLDASAPAPTAAAPAARR